MTPESARVGPNGSGCPGESEHVREPWASPRMVAADSRNAASVPPRHPTVRPLKLFMRSIRGFRIQGFSGQWRARRARIYIWPFARRPRRPELVRPRRGRRLGAVIELSFESHRPGRPDVRLPVAPRHPVRQAGRGARGDAGVGRGEIRQLRVPSGARGAAPLRHAGSRPRRTSWTNTSSRPSRTSRPRSTECAAPQFKRHSDALAPFIVPGSQHWVVYRVLDERAG